MKQLLKQLLSLLHISVTRNQKYDAYTRKIIRQSLAPDSNCLDIGCHKGEILDLMIEGAPQGNHFGFEPIPEFYHFLKDKYAGNQHVSIFPTALYDQEGTTSFQHVLNAPAYSGIKKRKYDGKQVDINQITVVTGMLDNIIPPDFMVSLVKIDVEGAEFRVLKGAIKTLVRCKPLIIFEFGLGAADFYSSKPDELYSLVTGECSMKISTLKGYIGHDRELSQEEFCNMYNAGTEYYFVAHPR